MITDSCKMYNRMYKDVEGKVDQFNHHSTWAGGLMSLLPPPKELVLWETAFFSPESWKIAQKYKQILMKFSENVETLNLKKYIKNDLWVFPAGVQQVAVFNKHQCGLRNDLHRKKAH